MQKLLNDEKQNKKIAREKNRNEQISVINQYKEQAIVENPELIFKVNNINENALKAVEIYKSLSQNFNLVEYSLVLYCSLDNNGRAELIRTNPEFEKMYNDNIDLFQNVCMDCEWLTRNLYRYSEDSDFPRFRIGNYKTSIVTCFCVWFSSVYKNSSLLEYSDHMNFILENRNTPTTNQTNIINKYSRKNLRILKHHCKKLIKNIRLLRCDTQYTFSDHETKNTLNVLFSLINDKLYMLDMALPVVV